MPVTALSASQRSRLSGLLARCQDAASVFDAEGVNAAMSQSVKPVSISGDTTVRVCRKKDKGSCQGSSRGIVDLTGDAEEIRPCSEDSNVVNASREVTGGQDSLYDRPSVAMRQLLSVYLEDLDSKAPTTSKQPSSHKDLVNSYGSRHSLLSSITIGTAVCLVACLRWRERHAVQDARRPSFLLDLDAGGVSRCWWCVYALLGFMHGVDRYFTECFVLGWCGASGT